MKKLVLAMLVAAMAVPAFAAVNINATDEGNGILKLWYECTAGEELRGIALRIEADGNATIAGTSAAVVLAIGEFEGKSFGFNTYMDYAFTIESVTPGLYDPEIELGHPLAKADERGELVDFPASLFSVSMGALDNRGEQAGVGGSGELMTIQFDLTADAVISIAVDTLRGGVVGDGFEAEDVTVQASQTLIDGGVPECILPGHPDYAQWELVGKPDSWCNPRQCYGDANGQEEAAGKGTVWVGMDDLNILLAGFRQPYVNPTTSPWIAADFSRSEEAAGKGTVRVGMDDLNILLANFRQANIPTDCNN